MLSHEYSAAIVVVLVSLAKMIGIEIENEVLAGLVTGVLGLWIAIRRYRKGDITVVGSMKYKGE